MLPFWIFNDVLKISKYLKKSFWEKLMQFSSKNTCLAKNYIYIYKYKRAKTALICLLYYQISFKSVGLSVQEKKFNTDFQDSHGGHLGLPIRMILPTFDLQIISILPMKFRVNWPFGSRYFQWSFESIGLSVQEKKFKIDFQHGDYLGFSKERF